MQVKVLREAGYEEALLGLSLSFYDHKIPLLAEDAVLKNNLSTSRLLTRWHTEPEVFWTDGKLVRAERRAKALAFKGGGHNKFLESITVWLYIQAPRCWWSEYDTYRVGMTKNSSSTMHTLDKRETEPLVDYEHGTSFKAIEEFNNCLRLYKDPMSPLFKDITRLKLNLPEGFLQERQITTNYMTLQNILNQREGHRLRFWNTHRDELLAQLSYPELLVPEAQQ